MHSTDLVFHNRASPSGGIQRVHLRGSEGERQRAGREQGKVLYVRNYPNPSFGPFVEVCCSIIGCVGQYNMDLSLGPRHLR